MLKTLKITAAAVAAVVVMTGSASALTGVTSGGSYDITSDNAFIGAASSNGGAGSYSVNFTSPTDPLRGKSNASLTQIVLGAFTGLTVSWLDAATSSILNTAAVVTGVTSLNTTFSGANLSQNLVFNWTDSKLLSNGQPVKFDFDVSAVPLPAGGLLLLTALGGLGVVRRRKTGAAVAAA